MNSFRNRILAIATLTFAAFCATAAPVSAQNSYKGTFALTHEIRWQNITLPAGAYSFELKSLASPLLILTGPNGSEFISAIVADQRHSKDSKLVVEHRNGMSVVSELQLAEIGLRLRYSVPKAPKDVELASAHTREEILVAASFKK
jgi:hypothetical protein